MKILIVSWYFPPTSTMGALRVGRLAEYLHDQGYDVRVLTARDLPWRQTLDQAFPEERVVRAPWWDVNAPPRAAARLRNRLRRQSAHSEQAEADAAAAASAGSDGGGGAMRALSKLYMSLTNWPDETVGWLPAAVRAGRRMIAEDRPDIIFASGPPFTTLAIGRSLAVRSKIPWIAEFRDRWWDDPYYPGATWRRQGERMIERHLVRSTSGLVTVSEPWAEGYRKRYGKPTLTVFNGYDSASLSDDSPGATDTPKLRILYTGIIYPGRRDPTPLFAALRTMDRADDVRVQFYGCSPADVMPLAERQHVSHLVEVCPPVPYREAVALQRQSDVLLLMQWNNPGESGNVPGKLFEYLAARRPILGLGYTDGVPAQIIRERNAGLYSNNPEEIARQIGEWLAIKREVGSLPALPEAVKKGFSRAEQYAQLEAFFADALSEGTKDRLDHGSYSPEVPDLP